MEKHIFNTLIEAQEFAEGKPEAVIIPRRVEYIVELRDEV